MVRFLLAFCAFRAREEDSIGGISHHYSENTADEDLVLGCRVLADAAETILKQAALKQAAT